MRKCIGCEAEIGNDLEYCPECGEPIADYGEGSDLSPEAVDDIGDESLPHLLLESGERLELKAGDIVLGRMDPIEGIHPDLDLTSFRAYDLGVSRKHAIILRDADEYMLEDLGSANGTIVNTEKAEPGVRIPLKEGDTIFLGKLKATFHTLGEEGGLS